MNIVIASLLVQSVAQAKLNLTLFNAGRFIGHSNFIGTVFAVSSITELFRPIALIVSIIGFLFGCIVAMQGFLKLRQGEEGILQIIGGIGMAIAMPLIGYAFAKFGQSEAVIQPGE